MKTYLFRIRLNSGGYDSNGSYWGLGQPLYQMLAADGETHSFRARDRNEAKERALKIDPNAKFFR